MAKADGASSKPSHFTRGLIAMQIRDFLDHLLGKTRVAVDRNRLSLSDFAFTLIEKGCALQPLSGGCLQA